MINCNPIFAEYVKKSINLPTECPVCKGNLTITDSGFVECQNIDCQQKVVHMLAEFFKVLDIRGAGDSFVDNLVNVCGVRHIHDLFEDGAQKKFIEAAGGVNGMKVFDTLMEALKSPMSLPKFVALFDLRGFGEKKFLDLDQLPQFKEFYENPVNTLFTLKLQDFQTSHPASMVSAEVINKFAYEFGLKRNDMVRTAKIAMIKFAAKEEVKVVGGKLEGKSFCFTGAMDYKRSDLEKMVVDNGGTVSSVKKGLTFLVQADPSSTSSKSVKAKSLGIEIISPEDFLAMVK
jgi:NAD-dependent DNA ligase